MTNLKLCVKIAPKPPLQLYCHPSSVSQYVDRNLPVVLKRTVIRSHGYASYIKVHIVKNFSIYLLKNVSFVFLPLADHFDLLVLQIARMLKKCEHFWSTQTNITI